MGAHDTKLKTQLVSRHYDLLADARTSQAGYGTPASSRTAVRKLAGRIQGQFLPHYFTNPPKWRLAVRKLARRRTLPDFCVIGPGKAGTSDLAVSIMSHPNVLPPFSKEFWSSDPETWRKFYPTERQKKNHAKRHGAAMSPFCVPCLSKLDIPYRLSQIKPDMKVVIVLREPAERLYSHWKWEVLLAGKRYVESLPFLSTFSAYVDMSLSVYGCLPTNNPCSARGLEMSIYWRAVEHWMTCFGKANLLVLDVREYFDDRLPVLHRIQSFVGLPYFDNPFLEKTNANPLQLPPADEESMEKLRTFFQPHNERLWQIIGKKFAW